MPNPLFAFKKLSKAIDELTTGPGPIRDRLYNAAPWVLAAGEGNMPNERLREMLKEIVNEAAKVTQGRESQLKIKKAIAIARRIVELHTRLEDFV